MTITNYTAQQVADVVTVTVTSDLTPPVYLDWWLDAVYVGRTTDPSRSFRVDTQARVDVFDTTDPASDPLANPPAGSPTVKTLWWVRSLATDVDHYRIEQQQDGGDWATIARLPTRAGQWGYSHATDRLDDLSDYAWRVYPVDQYGNDGTVLTFAAERIVRVPDSPTFAVSFDVPTTKVTFSAS